MLSIAIARLVMAVTIAETRKQSLTIVNVFCAHDWSFYRTVAESWYPSHLSPVWHVFPLYPAMVRLGYLLGIDVTLSGFMVASICGLASMPVFQITVERYFSRTQALSATILYFLLPPVFVFSGVNYAEPVFLLCTLLAWRFQSTGKNGQSVMAATASSLARAIGIIITIPLAYNCFRKRQFKQIIYLVIPFFALSCWIAYGYWMTGGPAYFASNIYWQSANISMFRVGLIEILSGNLSGVGFILAIGLTYLPITIAACAAVILVLALSWKVLRIDKALGVYAFAYLLALSVFGFPATFGSYPRFLGFLFPIGLPLHTRRVWLLAIAAAGLLVLDYFAWLGFLANGFI